MGDSSVSPYIHRQYSPPGTRSTSGYVKTTSTSEEEGFDYTFDGEFLRGGVISDAASRKAVLKGKLAKLKQGRKVSECQVKFRVEYLGC